MSERTHRYFVVKHTATCQGMWQSDANLPLRTHGQLNLFPRRRKVFVIIVRRSNFVPKHKCWNFLAFTHRIVASERKKKKKKVATQPKIVYQNINKKIEQQYKPERVSLSRGASKGLSIIFVNDSWTSNSLTARRQSSLFILQIVFRQNCDSICCCQFSEMSRMTHNNVLTLLFSLSIQITLGCIAEIGPLWNHQLHAQRPNRRLRSEVSLITAAVDQPF